MNDLIREKTDLKTDGAALIGQAFGGNTPLLKVNALQNESEKNVQTGIENIIRGIIAAIRNPRSHKKHEDSQPDADAIILFINYLINIINKSRAPYSLTDMLKRVYDENYPESEDYTCLLIEEIPPGKRLEVALATFDARTTGDRDKLKIFFRVLLRSMTKEDIISFYRKVSDDFKYINEESEIRSAIAVIPIDDWKMIDEVPRMRIEHILLSSAQSGKYDAKRDKCSSGSLGTWASSRIENFCICDEFVKAMCNKLISGDIQEKDYVFKWFFDSITKHVKEIPQKLQKTLINGLKSGDIRYYNGLCSIEYEEDDHPWKVLLIEHLRNFEEAAPSEDLGDLNLDDLPF